MAEGVSPGYDVGAGFPRGLRSDAEIVARDLPAPDHPALLRPRRTVSRYAKPDYPGVALTEALINAAAEPRSSP